MCITFTLFITNYNTSIIIHIIYIYFVNYIHQIIQNKNKTKHILIFFTIKLFLTCIPNTNSV